MVVLLLLLMLLLTLLMSEGEKVVVEGRVSVGAVAWGVVVEKDAAISPAAPAVAAVAAASAAAAAAAAAQVLFALGGGVGV